MQDNNIQKGVIYLVGLILIGTLFYTTVEGFDLVNAFYLAGSTITTLGFGDFVPTTELGKIFTIPYSIIGVIIIFFIAAETSNSIKRNGKRKR